MDAYRGVAKLLDRRQVAPGATVSLAVRAWVGTGFVGITPHTAWGKSCAGQSTGVLGRRDRRAHRTDHSRWFCAGGGGQVGKPVHTVYGLYNVSKLRGHNYSLKEASGKANCLIRDSSEGCGFPCRRVHLVGKDASTCSRQIMYLESALINLQDMRWV